MPMISKKKKLVRRICVDALVEMFMDDFADFKVFDDSIEDVLIVSSQRYTVPRLLVPKSEEWFNRVLPRYNNADFKVFVRVSRYDFGRILEMIENSQVFREKNSQKQLNIDRQLAITLNKLGNDGSGSGIKNTAALFGVGGGGTVMKVVMRVLKAIIEHEKEWIKWPDENERKQITDHMADKLPNCIGYIDGSHINLDEAPQDDPESYFTRKQRYAIQIQAICDNEKLIRNLFVGYPGSVHDARVYANSDIGKHPEQYLTDGQWLAGDSAYCNSDYMITPFKRNATTGTTAERNRFNTYFSSFRVQIECCFGALKETFGSLKGLRIRVDRASGHKQVCQWIRACAILYNITKDSLDEYEGEGEEEEDEESNIAGRGKDSKREALFQFVNGKLNM